MPFRTGAGTLLRSVSPELGELDPDPVRVLNVRVAAPGLLHLEDHGMARPRSLRERGVEVLDREGEVVQPLSNRVGCVERGALLIIVQLEGIAALSFANEFNDGPLRRVDRVSAAHLHPEEGRVELHGRLEVLHANAGVEELGLHGLGTPEVCRWIKGLGGPALSRRFPERARWPPYAPFCSDGIGLSVLPGALRLLGLAPVGCRRLTRSRVNVLAGRFILDAGCVVSAPLPALSGPSACAGPPYLGRGDVPQQPRRVTVGRPRSPGRARHPCGPIWT